MGWGIGGVPEVQARAALSSGELVALLPGVVLPVSLFWHQWKLAPDGTLPSSRVAMLDRIGAALAAGARTALGGAAAGGQEKVSARRSRGAPRSR